MKLLDIAFGPLGSVMMLAMMAFAFLGAMIFLVQEARGRDQGSLRTPEQWSWRFYLRDNWSRLLLGMLLTYVFIRFSSALIVPFMPSDSDEMLLLASVVVGYSFDRLSHLLKNRIPIMKANGSKDPI